MIMSLLRPDPRPTKKQRRQETRPRRQETPQGETKLEPSGVATLITVDWRFQLIAQGDRHNMSSIKEDWEQYFKDKAPYQVYTIPDEPLFIQYSPNKQDDEVIRIEFSDEQVGNAIREHAKSKKWIWRDNISNIEIVQICRDFTRLLNDQTAHRREISRGAKEDDDGSLEHAAKREIYEEFGITNTGNLHKVGDYHFSDPKGRPQTTRCYHLNISHVDVLQRERDEQTNWFCPLSFYEFLDNVPDGFKEIKARHETRNIRISDLNESLSRPDQNLKKFIMQRVPQLADGVGTNRRLMRAEGEMKEYIASMGETINWMNSR